MPADLSPPLVPAIGYVRVSTMREEAISPQTQRAAVEACAARKGFTVIDWAEDLDVSGRTFKRKITAVIDRVKAGEAEKVIVWKYSRFGRTRKGNRVYLAELEDAGGELVSATEDVDATTATGKFQRGVLLEMAAYESDRIGETWAETHAWRLRQGLPAFGGPRFGYVRLGRVQDEDDPRRTRHVKGEEERYAPDEKRGAEALAQAYRSYIAGSGFQALANSMNAAGWRTVTGRKWRAQAVRDVLDAGFGAGLLMAHNPKCECKLKLKAKCPNKAWLPGAQPPVISPGEWEAYRERRRLTGDLPPRARSPRYALTGLARCGHCRSAMAVNGRGEGGLPIFVCTRQRAYQDCPGHPSVTVARLTEAVKQEVSAWAADIDAAAARERSRQQVRAGAEGEVARLEGVLAEHDRRLANMVRDREDTVALLGKEAWQAAARRKRAERDEAAADLEAAKARTARTPSADLRPVMAGLMDTWDLLPAEGLNSILRALVRRVAVYREREPLRDSRGHWEPAPFKIKVHPVWEPDPWEGEMPRAGRSATV